MIPSRGCHGFAVRKDVSLGVVIWGLDCGWRIWFQDGARMWLVRSATTVRKPQFFTTWPSWVSSWYGGWWPSKWVIQERQDNAILELASEVRLHHFFKSYRPHTSALNNVGGHCPRPWLSLRQELSRVNSESGCHVHLSVSFWSSGCEILASWDPYVSNRFLKILELKWTTYPEAIIHNTFSCLIFFLSLDV